MDNAISASATKDFVDTLAANFSVLDRDGDRAITQGELTDAKSNQDIPVSNAFIAELQEHFVDISNMAVPDDDLKANVGHIAFDELKSRFGGDRDLNALTERDLEAMQLMLAPEETKKLDETLKNLRGWETGNAAWEFTYGTAAGLVALANYAMVAFPATTPVSPITLPIALTETVISAAGFYSGIGNITSKGTEILQQQVDARRQMLSSIG